MRKSIWNGTITFCQVNVPVKLYSATESKTVHFHELHEKDGARIEHRRFCSKEGKEVPYGEVVKGYEVSDGKYVVLEKDEVAAADPSGGNVIELEDFVKGEEIDPVYYDRTYYAGVQDGAEDCYRLLLEALTRSDRVGIGRFVFHNRERLVAVRALDDLLGVHVMRFADEVVSARELDIEKPQKAPGKRELEMARTLVSSLESGFKPTDYKDSYRARVLDLIKKRAAGKRPKLPEPEKPETSDDLMAALEASLGSNGGSARGKSKARS
jgi:DNA end-binding protein Ku